MKGSYSTVWVSERIFIELLTSDLNLRRLEGVRNEGCTGPKRLDDTRCETYNRAGMILLPEDVVMPGLILRAGWPYPILPVNKKTRRVWVGGAEEVQGH